MDFNDNSILIEGLINGDEKAYMFLLEKFHRRLNAYALTLVNDHSMAQDIVQNVFLKTWKSRKKLNPDYSIQSFLYKSVYNDFINNFQKNRAMMLVQKKYFESMQHIMDNTDENSIEIMIDIVNKEIQNLPPKCKEIFVMSKKEGLTNAEIAEYLNVSTKAVEAQVTKAFGFLRKKLGNKFNLILTFIFGVSVEDMLMEFQKSKTGC